VFTSIQTGREWGASAAIVASAECVDGLIHIIRAMEIDAAPTPAEFRRNYTSHRTHLIQASIANLVAELKTVIQKPPPSESSCVKLHWDKAFPRFPNHLDYTAPDVQLAVECHFAQFGWDVEWWVNGILVLTPSVDNRPPRVRRPKKRRVAKAVEPPASP
jgi:hypothetical protein